MVTHDLASRVATLQRRLGQTDGYRAGHVDPHILAKRVLEYCRKDLGLPADVRLDFADIDDRGVVYTHAPRVLHINGRLLDSPTLLVETVGHEAKHCQLILGHRYEYDSYAEDAAREYGLAVARNWRF